MVVEVHVRVREHCALLLVFEGEGAHGLQQNKAATGSSS